MLELQDNFGCTVWLTGLPSSGKSTLANALCSHLASEAANLACYNIDGDILRSGLCATLGFSEADRAENVRRCAEVAIMMAKSGLVCVVSLISPQTNGRAHARELHVNAGLKFFEVYLSTPLDTCERRDVKGLYAKARRNELQNMTGIDAVYEAPTNPDVVLDTTNISVDDCICVNRFVRLNNILYTHRFI